MMNKQVMNKHIKESFKKASKPKYKNKKDHRRIGSKTYYFDSKAEARYFDELYKQAKDHKISSFMVQPEYEISNGFSISTNKTKNGKSTMSAMKYTPDFRYTDEYGKKVVVEVKGEVTTDYRMRLKLFLSQAYTKYRVDIFKEVICGKEYVYHTDTVQIKH